MNGRLVLVLAGAVAAATIAAATVAAAGCARPEPRFADRAVLWHDVDDAPVAMPKPRQELGTGRFYTGAQNAIFRPANRFLSGDYGLEAVNVNAVDDVPASTWFDDPRRDPSDPGRPPRALAPDEIDRAASDDDEPPRPPFHIVRALSGGSAVGFAVDDALGRRWALKLDPVDHRGLITSTDAVCARLLWASGWRVPANQIIAVARVDLIVQPDATMTNRYGRRVRFDAGDLDSMLWQTAKNPDGSYQVVASRWVGGHVLGPFSWLGRDKSDANDRYDHENRRDLRGFGVWSAWVDNIDAMEQNTLDTYVGRAGDGHVEHYQLDVGGSFGSFSAAQAQFWMGDQSYFQFDRLVGGIVGLGVVPHRWESSRWQKERKALLVEFPEFGGFSGDHFELRKWRPITDTPPFVRQTDRDRYWGAKRIAAFSPEELRAAIAAGRYRAEAAEHLFGALWRRREVIARDGFGHVAPLDYFRVDGGRLCFYDWWVRAGLGGGSATTYRAREGGNVVDIARGSDRDGAACVALPAHGGYRIVELAALRPGERRFGPAVDVHLLAQADGRARVLGVVR